MNLLTMQSASYHFLRFRSKYSTQHPVLEHIKSRLHFTNIIDAYIEMEATWTRQHTGERNFHSCYCHRQSVMLEALM